MNFSGIKKILDDHLYKIKEIIIDAKNNKLVKKGKILCKINNLDKKICFSSLHIRNTDGSVTGTAIIFEDMTGESKTDKE